MNYKGLAVTGTSGAGKTSVVDQLCDKFPHFRLVQAVTTREPRKDDNDKYLFLSDQDFQKLEDTGSLAIRTLYRGSKYGITHDAIEKVLKDCKIPILVVTPDTISGISPLNPSLNTLDVFLPIFLDAKDSELDARLINRDGNINGNPEIQRQVDRTNKDHALYVLQNDNVDKTASLISQLWDFRSSSGILTKRLIELMISCGSLLKNADLSQVSYASYDLRIGDEYYYCGQIKTLDDKNPFILIEPYDYAIVTCKETACLPADTIARFDLSISLFCQGIILSNGPQVDPGFRGKLFCLLFNTSNGPVFLKRGQHYATIEFHKLIEPTISYSGKYQDKEQIIHYLPANTLRGAINELKKELEQVRNESKILQNVFLGVISLILAIIAILLTLR